MLPLDLDEVGRIFENACRKSDDLYRASALARAEVSDQVLVSFKLVLTPEQAGVLEQVNRMCALSALYYMLVKKNQPFSPEQANEAMEIQLLFAGIAGYLEDHWDDLPEGDTKSGWLRQNATEIRVTVIRHVSEQRAEIAKRGVLAIDSERFKDMRDCMNTPYQLILGDETGQLVIRCIARSMAHLSTLAHVASQAQKMDEMLDKNKKGN